MPSGDPNTNRLEQLIDRVDAIEAEATEQAQQAKSDEDFHQALRHFRARERAEPFLRADYTFEQNQALFRGWLKWRYPDRQQRLAYLRAAVRRG